MPTVSFLTARFLTAHPVATVDIRSMTSQAIQRALDGFEIDGGLTYLDNEPLAKVRRFPLYRERYVFVARRQHPLATRDTITWREAASERLCLLSTDMQNRRIIDKIASFIGVTIRPSIAGNSFLAICSHLRHGDWASIVPHTFFHAFGPAPDLVAIGLVEPEHSQAIGLVLSDRDPASPMAAALLAAALRSDFETELQASHSMA